MSQQRPSLFSSQTTTEPSKHARIAISASTDKLNEQMASAQCALRGMFAAFHKEKYKTTEQFDAMENAAKVLKLHTTRS